MNPSERIAQLTQSLTKANHTIHNQRKQLRSLHRLWRIVSACTKQPREDIVQALNVNGYTAVPITVFEELRDAWATRNSERLMVKQLDAQRRALLSAAGIHPEEVQRRAVEQLRKRTPNCAPSSKTSK